jgi:hypothetical protein
MRRGLLAWGLSFGLSASCADAHASEPDSGYDPINTQVGNALQIVLPIAGLGLTWLLRGRDNQRASGSSFSDGFGDTDWTRLDGTPRHDFLIAFARTETITYGLKYSVDEDRPNGSPHSFPSGHTSASFMGAEFIRKQYGWFYGAPAYAAASYVGWTREQSRNHYTRDVLAGAVIGILSNHDLSSFRIGGGSIDIGVGLFDVSPQPFARDEWSDPAVGAVEPVPGLAMHWVFGS